MTYRKSDGPFGMLPKKTAMDLEREGGETLFTIWKPEDDGWTLSSSEWAPSEPRPMKEPSVARESDR
ncbi:MAG: hypothetical protein GY769_18765 [bacterium]|nr:hypothetical protein [bacterium]